jgi:hypothetical protein
MAVETDLERAVFFEVDDFGTTAIYTPDGGESVTIQGIFDNNHEEVDAGGGVPFSIRGPQYHARTADVPQADEGDTLEIGGIVYTVRVVMPDGTGLTMLQLEAP